MPSQYSSEEKKKRRSGGGRGGRLEAEWEAEIVEGPGGDGADVDELEIG